jgi:ABC-type transporter MlaC component
MIGEKEIMDYFYKQRDPPEEDKAFQEDKTFQEIKQKIKRKIREELDKNIILSNSLEEHKAKGKFIKEFTNSLIRKYGTQERFIESEIINSIKNPYHPIDSSFCWHNTAQGGTYWRVLDCEINKKLSEERRKKRKSF